MLSFIWAGSSKVSFALVKEEVEDRDQAVEDTLRQEMKAMESRLSEKIDASALKTNANIESKFEALAKIMTRADPKFEQAAIEIEQEDSSKAAFLKRLKRKR